MGSVELSRKRALSTVRPHSNVDDPVGGTAYNALERALGPPLERFRKRRRCICGSSSTASGAEQDHTTTSANRAISHHGPDQCRSCLICSERYDRSLSRMFKTVTEETYLGTLQDCWQRTSCPLSRIITAAFPAEEFVKPHEIFGARSSCSVFIGGRKWRPPGAKSGETHHRPSLRIAANTLSAAAKLMESLSDVQALELVLPRTGSGLVEVKNIGEGLKRRALGQIVDERTLSKWLDLCAHNHDHDDQVALRSTNTQSLPSLLAIDVLSRQIVPLPPSQAYFALSYVWGDCTDMRDLTAWLRENSNTGGSLPAVLPQTIKDAVTITAQLGCQYLWVDAVCIASLGPVDRLRVIRNMDSVYANASLTLVAAAGSSASHGLQGVRKRRPDLAEPIILEDELCFLSLAAPSLSECLSLATWSRRAWTFQEHVLSSRCLYFTEREAFFACSEAAYRESCGVEDIKCSGGSAASPWSALFGGLPSPGVAWLSQTKPNGFEVYAAAVAEYTHDRKLRFREQIITAFAGVLKRFGPHDGASMNLEQLSELRHGLPFQHFEHALQWLPSVEHDESLANDLGSDEHSAWGDDLFPSWSWASWRGRVQYVNAEAAESGPSNLFTYTGSGMGDVIFGELSADACREIIGPHAENLELPTALDLPSMTMGCAAMKLCLWTCKRRCRLRLPNFPFDDPAALSLDVAADDGSSPDVDAPSGMNQTWLIKERIAALVQVLANDPLFATESVSEAPRVYYTFEALLIGGSRWSRDSDVAIMLVEKKGEFYRRIGLTHLPDPRVWFFQADPGDALEWGWYSII